MQGNDRGSAAAVIAPRPAGAPPVGLPRVVDRARLADDGDLDLAGVLQALLDLLRDVAGQPGRPEVVDRVRLDEDPDLAPGLDGEALVDAVEGVGDPLQRLQPLDVGLDHLPPRPRPRPADRVGGGDDEGLDRLRLLLAVVGGDGVDDLAGAAEPLGDVGPDQGVRPLHLVVDRLADVVQQAGGLGDVDVGPDLRRQRRRDQRRLQRVVQHVLAVGGAEPQPAQQLDEVRVEAGDVRLVGDLLPLLPHHLLQLGPGLLDDLLDPGRVDAAVLQQLGQRPPGDFPPDRVEAGDGHRLRRVVDDQVDPGRLLQGADVASLAADDPPLHVVRGERDDGDGRLGDVVGGDPLDGRRQHLAGAALGLLVQFEVDLVQAADGHRPRLRLHLAHQLVARLVGGQAGDPLQLGEVAAAGLVEVDLLAGPVLRPRLAPGGQLLLPGVAGPGQLEVPRVAGAADFLLPLADGLLAAVEAG